MGQISFYSHNVLTLFLMEYSILYQLVFSRVFPSSCQFLIDFPKDQRYMTYVHENKIVTSEKDSPNCERLLYYFLPPFFFLPLAVRVMFYWIAANSISLDGRRAIALLTLPSSFFHIVNNFLRLSTTPSLKYHSYLHFDRIFIPILIYCIWSMHFVCTFYISTQFI